MCKCAGFQVGVTAYKGAVSVLAVSHLALAPYCTVQYARMAIGFMHNSLI